MTFETGRPGVFGTGDVRIGAATVVQAIAEGRRAAYAVDAFLRGNDLAAIRTRQTLAEPQPEFLSIVPFTERGEGAALPDEGHGGRGAQPELRRVRDPVHAARRSSPSRRAASSAPARRSATATCAASGIEYGTTLTTLEPQPHQGAGFRSVTENRFTGVNHDYIRDD